METSIYGPTSNILNHVAAFSLHSGDRLLSNGLPDRNVSAKSDDPCLASANQKRGKALPAFDDKEIAAVVAVITD